MDPATLVTALQLPASTRVDQRVPKKMLVESGAPTAADKRLINEQIAKIRWLAAIKPGTVGVAAYQDAEREYLEIALLHVTARQGLPGQGTSTRKKTINTTRMAELVHRAIPYPVALILQTPGSLLLSLAHKRWAQNEAGKVVLDGEVTTVALGSGSDTEQAFIQSLMLAAQPQASMLALYQGWIDCVVALQAAAHTGRFTRSATPAAAAARRQALRDSQRLQEEAARLRAQATKEKQMARRVELNLALQRVKAELASAREQL